MSSKTNCFSMPKTVIKAKNRRENARFGDWKMETGNTDLGHYLARVRIDGSPFLSYALFVPITWR
jgi:hypothetical protein